MIEGVKEKIADHLSIPGANKLQVRSEAKGEDFADTLPELLFLASKDERPIPLHPAFMI